jgi:DNA-binding LacI/PurR family transcriptional regulator
MPAVVIGSPRGSSSLPAVWQDEHSVVSAIVGHLAELGHTRIARVGGLPQYWHTALRAAAFAEVAAAFGVDVVQAEADYTAEHGAAATSSLLAGPLSRSGACGPGGRPTAIVYDNDVMAVAGLSCATRLGFGVPSDVSIVSWDDSALCELTNPPLTAMGRDIAWIGSTAARLLRSLVSGEEVASVREAAPGLVIRGSTGSA